MFIEFLVTENYLTQTSGEISNPMYPKSYSNSDHYSWTINVKESKVIQIVLKEFTCSSSVHHLKVSNDFIYRNNLFIIITIFF